MNAPRAVDLVVRGGTALTMDPGRPVIEDAFVAIEDGRIAAIGSQAALSAGFTATTTIDATGHAILPGLVDAYAHAGHGMIPGLFHPEEGWPSGELYWHRTTPAWWRAEADLAALQRTRFGVTTALSVVGGTPARADDPRFADALAAGHADAGLGLVLAIGPPDPFFPHLSEPWEASLPDGQGGFVRRRFTEADTIRVVRDVAARWNNAADGAITVALHPPYLLGRHVAHRRLEHALPGPKDAPTLLAHAQAMRALAHELGLALHTHLFRGSVRYAHAYWGEETLAEILAPTLTAAHCNGLEPDEVALLGRHRVGIAAVATTHETVWYGAAPVAALIDAGCPVAIATDGAAPYTSHDLWREMARTAWQHWRGPGGMEQLPPETLLRMVTIDAARALGQGDRIGSLEPGKQADLILLDLDAPHLAPAADLASILVFYANAADIRTVIARGRVLLADGRPTMLDPAAIVARARAEARASLDGMDLARYRRPAGWSGTARWSHDA